jgi:hypothetical protein
MNTNARPPVIIIGMHRAGTSMLTRTLQAFGYFMGRKTTRNQECFFTNNLNYWIFGQASATWERPEGVDTLLAEPNARALVTDYLSGVVEGPASWRYLGVRRWLRYRSMKSIKEPWGWKDPRNTYTLPIWLDIFPEAKVLHIIRNGVDVARSLLVRRQLALTAAARRFQHHRIKYVNNPLAPKRSGFAHSARCSTLAGGLDLWEAYTMRANGHVRALGNDRALELRYEDILHDPYPFLERIAVFCGLKVDEAVLSSQSKHFNSTRAFAYRSDPELIRFAEMEKERLRRFGY